MRSMSVASRPASARAALAALIPSQEVVSLSAAMWRCSIPVRCTIHSCDVSICVIRSLFVTTRSGK